MFYGLILLLRTACPVFRDRKGPPDRGRQRRTIPAPNRQNSGLPLLGATGHPRKLKCSSMLTFPRQMATPCRRCGRMSGRRSFRANDRLSAPNAGNNHVDRFAAWRRHRRDRIRRSSTDATPVISVESDALSSVHVVFKRPQHCCHQADAAADDQRTQNEADCPFMVSLWTHKPYKNGSSF
jgi:hypothetical protein